MSGTNVSVPRVRITANGALLSGIVDVQWTAASAYNAGTFQFTKAFTANDANGPAWWAGTGNKQIAVNITIATDGQTFNSVFTGAVDSHVFDPIGRTIQVSGRDGAAVFIDARITDTYRNLTASEIATKLAAGHGYTAVVTNTTTLVGRYYDADNDATTAGSFSRAVSEWDMLCLLGQKEGILPCVIGTVLYFQTPASPAPVFPVWMKQSGSSFQSNALSIELDRSLTMARDVSVTVKSWHSGKKAVVVGKAVTKTAVQPDQSVPPSNYVFYMPNLTRAQADAAAQKLAMDIAAHERVLQFKIPGETVITPQHVVTLAGTGTDYDGVQYFPDQITSSVSVQGGFTTSISCKNYSPLSLYDGASGVLIR